jgi:hypothetical protein
MPQSTKARSQESVAYDKIGPHGSIRLEQVAPTFSILHPDLSVKTLKISVFAHE